MPVSHRPDSYGPLAKTAHWLIAALVAVLFILAWTFLLTPKGARHDQLVALHQSFGAIVLVVMLGRIVGRIRTVSRRFRRA